jgi:hypothetical protein
MVVAAKGGLPDRFEKPSGARFPRNRVDLNQRGVPVEFHLHPGDPHEYDAIAFDADVSQRALADRHRVLKSV